jgi:antirestriction protein ArdC
MAKGRGGADDAIAEARAEVVSQIAEAMERDGLAWAAEWRGCWSPTNPTTGRAYRGLNRVSLAVAMHHGGFEDPRWCTFNQLRDAGWHVERGTKAAGSVEFWSWYVSTKRFGGTRAVTLQRAEQLVRDGRLPEEALGGAFLSGRLHHVFNGSQIVGIGSFDMSAHAPAAPGVERMADEFIASSRCPVAEVAGDRAFYRPSEDRIYLPRRAQFTTMDGFARAATCASKAADYVTGRRERLLEERARAIALDARQAVPTDARPLSERAGTARAAGGLVHAGPCRAMGEPGPLEP